MRNKFFIALALAAVLLTSAMFMPTTNAESKVATTNFATCKVKKNNANFFVTATEGEMNFTKLIDADQLGETGKIDLNKYERFVCVFVLSEEDAELIRRTVGLG